MDKSTIQRKDLKKNFLKEIIMRLDFQGVLQAEMEKILLEVKPYLKQKHFDRYQEKVNNQFINDGTGIKDVKAQIVYSFAAETLGYSLEMSASCIALSVKTQGYASFDEYSEIFCRIANIFKEKIDFFTCTRFGLRKINFCFVRNHECINDYFASEYYNCYAPIVGLSTQSAERHDKLQNGLQKLNLRYAVEQGQLGVDSVYKVTLDTDIYLAEQTEIEQYLFGEKQLTEINEVAFRIYLGVLTEKMIGILTDDQDCETDEVLGVESNE